MPKELIAFLNFEFRKNMVSVKSVSGDTMTEVPRIAINWKEYQALLASVGVKSSVEERPLFRRYTSYLSSEDLYTDLIAFQAELRQTLTAIVDTGNISEAVWKRIFKDTNGLPMFIEPEGEGDWNFDNAHEMSFSYDFSADTYRLLVLAMVRGLILNRRAFSLTLDGAGKFGLPEEAFGPVRESEHDRAAAYTDAERRAALRAAVARDLPAALSRAVAENLPKALAETAAEKLPLVMDALVKAQLPQALAEAVEEALPEALSKAVAAKMPAPPETPVPPPQLAATEAEKEAVSTVSQPVNPAYSLSVPGLRFIGLDSSISVPAGLMPQVKLAPQQAAIEEFEPEDEDIMPQDLEPEAEPEPLALAETAEESPAPDFVFLSAEAEEQYQEEEPEDIEPVSFAIVGEDDIPPPLEEPLDFNPMEYADTFQEEAVEEGLALFDVGGPAAELEEAQGQKESATDGYIFLPAQPERPAEPEDEEIEDIEPTELAPPDDETEPDEEEPLMLCERVSADDTQLPEPREQALQEETEAEAEAAAADADETDDLITPLPLENEEQTPEDGWLPFVKIPSKKKGAKLPLEQRLATLEQRKKRRLENDAQDTFDF